MLRTILPVLTLAFGTVVHAQPSQCPNAPCAPLSMGALQVVSGTITELNVGLGMRYPSLVINNVLLRVAPAWYLLDQDFELKLGDFVSVSAAPSSVRSDGLLYAVSITKGTVTLRLRDDNGRPLWSAGAWRSSSSGLGQQGRCRNNDGSPVSK